MQNQTPQQRPPQQFQPLYQKPCQSLALQQPQFIYQNLAPQFPQPIFQGLAPLIPLPICQNLAPQQPRPIYQKPNAQQPWHIFQSATLQQCQIHYYSSGQQNFPTFNFSFSFA